VSSRFVRIRSPLLREIGDPRDPETPGILRRRRAALAGIAALAAAFVLLTRAGLLPLPALDVLYVLHDYVALPFWGYAWTLSAPYSITWWSLVGVALAIWLATFLTRLSAVRGLHARLCRVVVVHLVAQSSRSSRHVARLTAWVDWLTARTLGAELLKDVVRLEQADALAAIVAAGSTLDERAAWRLVRLTDLLARLTSHARAPVRERWRSLAIWHQALMWIEHRSGTAPRTGAVAELFAALAATGRSLLDRLDGVDDVEDDTLSSGLRRDLHYLVEYASAFAPGASAFAPGATADKPADKAAGPSFGRAEPSFMRSVLERLDELWALVERGSLDEGAPTLTTRAHGGVIEAQGILVSSIGLHAASQEDDVHIAEAHLQAFEALGFVGCLGAAGREGSRVARALAAEAPERDHYRLVADIAERHRARRATAPSVGRAVLDEAVRHEQMRIGGLHDAAGSEFASAFALRVSARQAPPSAGQGRDLRSRLRWRIRYRPLPLRMRVDPVLLGGVAAAVIAYCAATATLVLLIFGSADLAGWTARSLPDPRVLENVRRGLDTAPFLDAVFHAPDRQLVVSQQGGVLHSYDPATGLWSTAHPFGPNDLARPDIRLLASSSADGSGALWGITTDGGLVRRLNGRWQVIVGDTKFLGTRGTPVQQAELSAVAASADGKWLLAAAGAEGVGLQDLERRRWLSRDEISPNGSPAAVTHAVWWRDRFYVGGPDGVSELAVDRPSTHSTSSGSTVSAVERSTGLRAGLSTWLRAGTSSGLGAGRPFAFRRVKGLEGAVVALEATLADGLFVHQTVRCENGPPACARLSRMTQPFTAPTVLIDERNRYTELSLDRLFYATQWKDHLLLAGSGGIFDYDTRLHAWKRHAAETISAIGGCAASSSSSSSSCFYYGYGGRASGVALFTPRTMTGDTPSRWPLAGEQPTRIAAETPGAAAVLTAAGRAYALAPGAVSTLINPATSSPVPLDRYRDAVTFGDKVLFFGRPGALLHDVVRRSYSPLRAVPGWLRSQESIVAASGSFLFGLERHGASYDAHVATEQQVELGTLFFNTSKPFRIDGPVRAVDASQPDVLRLIDGNGRVQSIAASGVTALTGGRSSALAHVRLLDVAGTAEVLAAATAGGVRLYSMRTRSWSDPLPAPAGERASEIADRQGTWIARSEANRLVLLGARPSVLIGGGEPMPRRQPTDVLQAGLDIYLSWPGTIQRYDPRSRQVAASWTFDGTEPVRLAGVIGSEPLSLAGGVARAGVREIARGVRDMFTTGSDLWLTREDRGRRYLEARPLASLAQQQALSIVEGSLLERRTAQIGPLRLTRVASERSERATGAERRPGAPQPVRRSSSEGGSDGAGGSGGAKPPGEETIDGAIQGALQVSDLQGRLSWMPIDLSTGRFPFDVVRSIAVVGNVLYVGTDAGLQAYDKSGVALEQMRLITLGADPSTALRAGSPAAPPTVERVGESCNDPGTAVACGPRGCARQAGSAFVDAPANALSCRLRARSAFWSWHVDASGLSGRYVITSVPAAPAPNGVKGPALSGVEGPALSGVEGPALSGVEGLANGLLPHDDVGQVVSFGGSTFTVWQGRFVGIHPTGLALAGATNHAFAMPVRLLSVTAPIPMVSVSRADDRDLSPGLYGIEGSAFAEAPAGKPRTWRYQKQGWTIVTDAAEAATIADYARHPPLLQRKRLRLVRHAPASAPLALRRGRPHTAPAFEMRMRSGDWTPLAWDASANRYALDVWQDIAVHQKTLWIATAAGLVNLDGNWSFNPDTFRVVAGPPQEAGRTATDLRVDGGVADLRYDGARAYRVAIEGSAPAVRLERDPFAEQSFDVDAKLWAWRITERTGSSAGRLAGTWKGEPIAVVNGRFDFDAVNSIAIFQGLLHLATNTRGWFALPSDSAALERLSRPSPAPIAPLDVAKLHGNRDQEEPELCLEGVDGQFARISPNGATRRTQGCPVLEARTGFWRYVRDGPTLRVLPAAGAARPGERRLVDGRFTDEVITGAPVTGMKNRRMFTVVPTSAGLIWWDATGQAVDMHAPPFQGKADVPRLLRWTAGDWPAYVADGTLYSLENDDKPRGSWTVRFPPKAVFERLGNGPGTLLSLDWSEGGRRHHSVVDPRNGSVSHDDVPVDARRIPAYFQRAMTEPSQDGLIRLRLRDHVVSAYAASEGWPIVETDDSFQLLAGVSYGTRTILVGPHHLIELNMERIARAVYSGGSPPAPPGSEK